MAGAWEWLMEDGMLGTWVGLDGKRVRTATVDRVVVCNHHTSCLKKKKS